MPRPRLAVVVVHYSTPTETAACLAALGLSERPCDHLVVVDNEAGNGTAAELRQAYPEVDWVTAPRNLGFACGANLGVRRALDRGAEMVFLLNSDAELARDCLGVLEATLARASAGIAGPAVVSRADGVTVESLGMRYNALSGRMRLLGWGAPLPATSSPWCAVDALTGCALLVRREVFERTGLLGEDYFFGYEDLDFCLRARRRGFAVVCAPGALVFHHGGASLPTDSPERAYFAARNHLLVAARARPLPQPLSALRAGCVATLNLAHVLLRSDFPRAAGVRAWAAGVTDYAAGRFGERRR